jgi:hypothetical protein
MPDDEIGREPLPDDPVIGRMTKERLEWLWRWWTGPLRTTTASADVLREALAEIRASWADRDRLRAESERRLRYIIETQQLLGTHDNIQVAAEQLMQECDRLRAELSAAHAALLDALDEVDGSIEETFYQEYEQHRAAIDAARGAKQ